MTHSMPVGEGSLDNYFLGIWREE